RDGAGGGGDVRERADLFADRLDVRVRELRVRAEPGPRSRGRRRAGEDHQEVRPERPELVLRLQARAFADSDRGDDARDADDDAERRQQRAQLVAREGAEGDFQDVRGLFHDGGLATMRRFSTGTSDTTRPSRNTTTRRACSAMSGSWVIRTTVFPSA